MTASRPERSVWGRGVALVISDVDGTLVSPDQRLTPRASAAVARLGDVGIGFTLISSRPPQGLSALAAALTLRLPFAAFNGAISSP